MDSTKFCSNCGKKIAVGAQFCPFCGAAQDSVSQSEEATQVASTTKFERPESKPESQQKNTASQANYSDNNGNQARYSGNSTGATQPNNTYMSNVMQATKDAINKTFVYNGRTSKMDYWYAFVGLMLLSTIAGFTLFLPIVTVVLVIMVFLVAISLTVRRYHDVNKPGTYFLFILIPIVGAYLMPVWLVQDSNQGSNQYGSQPDSITE